MNFSNFLNLNKNTILDFNKSNNEYKDIFISYNDEKENIIYAKKGNIFNEFNKYNFQLSNGFKISIDSENQIEKLEFKDYILKLENNNINVSEVVDKNTFTIFDDIERKNFLNITFKIIDSILVIYIIFLFYINNLKKINFTTKNNIYFILLCIFVLITNQILKNSEIILSNYTLIISLIIFLSILVSFVKKKYE
tara:strand:- start:167 stop:751 length:585 start_codon:yes stop_codon:yes gene_type:complete